MSQDNQEDMSVPDLLQLTCIEGPCEGTVFSKPGTSLAVGRTHRSKICIKDPSVSEKHAKIEWSGHAWVLQDLGSSNGTRVNGAHLQEDDEGIILNDLDIVNFGDSKLRVQVTPVPADFVTVEQYLRAECSRYEKRVTVKLAQMSNQLWEDWKAAKRELVQEALVQA